MKITQIAGALNTVINKLDIGATKVDDVIVTPTVAEDLGNIVDVGKAILDYTGVGNKNFDSFMEALIDQVGKITFVDRVYRSQAPNIMVDDWTYGSIMMKVRCELPDAQDNGTWQLASYHGAGKYPDPFELSPPDVEAKFYNTKTTYEVPITLCQVQLEQAVRSASDMQRLISMIENRVQVKRTLCNDGLVMQTLTNFIAGRIYENANTVGGSGRVINLLADYNTIHSGETGFPLSATKALQDEGFLRYATATMMKYKKYLAKASTRYNSGDYVTFTPADRLKFVVVADFAKDVEAYLYSGTYHDEFVKMDGYEEVADWGCSGTDADRFTIYKYLGSAIDGSEMTPVLINNPYVIGVMFDEWGAVCANRNDRVTSIYNPRGEYTNFFYKWDAAYLNDFMENCVVFTLGGPVSEAFTTAPTFAKGTNSDTTKITATANDASNDSLKYAINVTGGVSAGTDYTEYDGVTWTSLTSGTATDNVSVAENDIVTIIEIDGDDKIVAIANHKVASSEIK